MPEIIADTLDRVSKHFALVEKDVTESFQSATKAVNAHEAQLKSWKQFLASCDEGLSSRLKKIAKARKIASRWSAKNSSRRSTNTRAAALR